MRFGIVGTNFVSDFFMEGAKCCKECEVVAVTSRRYDNAVAFAERYSIPKAYKTYKEMCESGQIDAVYVATPNSTHKEIAMYFMSRGIHTFCEKPMASNASEVREMIECAKKNNVYLHEGIVPLFSPNFDVVKSNLERVGKIRQVYINMAQYSSRYDAYLRGDNPTTFRRELSNGALMDLGIYVFSHALALFGKPKNIYSVANMLDGGADVAGSSILEYDGFNATLGYSKASNTENKIEICGELGSIIIGHPTMYKSIVFVDRKTGERENLYKETEHSFAYQIRDMIEQIKSGRNESTKVSLDFSLTVHEVLTKSRAMSGIVFPCD